MRVQVNGRFMRQRVTGMQRYAREIVARLGSRVELVEPSRAGHGIRGHLWEQVGLPCQLRRSLLWSPCTTGPLGVGSQVVTIHDCAFRDRAECFTPRFAAWLQWLVPRLARRVRRILTVSQFSKDRIAEICRVPPDKIHVVHNGVDPRFHPATIGEIAAARAKFDLPENYLLSVGSLEPRKNLPRLLEAWQNVVSVQLASNQQVRPKLVLVGTTAAIFASAKLEAPAESVILTGYVPDELLPALYSGAAAFVYPSLYEGFGLTVLEAMACGTPVICSSTTSLSEVAGDAAVLVDPNDVAAIGHAIQNLLANDHLRSFLRGRGLDRVGQFTWDRAADETWKVLANAAN
ncbi:MAG: glycosyltransferase family 4 protein [Pirellulaceae bacterium]|nr:glycosyltransferase family 4 protein [Pirellulaceae bacterium]